MNGPAEIEMIAGWIPLHHPRAVPRSGWPCEEKSTARLGNIVAVENKKIFFSGNIFPFKGAYNHSNPIKNNDIDLISGFKKSSSPDWHIVCAKQSKPEFHGWKIFFREENYNV